MKKIIYLLIFSLLLGTLNVPLNIFAAEADEARTVVEGVTNVRLGDDAHVLTRGGFAKAVYDRHNGAYGSRQGLCVRHSEEQGF